MKLKKTILFLSILIIILFFTYKIYENFFKEEPKTLYKTEKIVKRDIYQNIYATGTLKIKDNMKIGSLVAGTIQKIYVKENDFVQKGQLLALIDNGKGDTDVKKTAALVERSKATLDYQEKYYERQNALYKTNQISKDYFEQVTRDLLQARADLKSLQAEHEKQLIDYNNTRIYAPDEGTIFNIGITIGVKITTDLDATVLFEIAKDIKKMEADLDIDESDIGLVKRDQKVKFTVGTYTDHIFKGKITEVGYAPKKTNNILSYPAKIEVDYGKTNKIDILRPGMTINAMINIGKGNDCIAIPSQAFQINPDMLQQIAKKINFQFKQLNKDEKKNLKTDFSQKYLLKYVWVVENESFVEKAVVLNITDDNYFEVINGIELNENVVVDIQELDEMEKLYKKMFKSAF